MIALLLVLAAGTPFQDSLAALSRSKAPAEQRLHALFDLAWQHGNEEFPERATFRGVPGYGDRWTDLSADAIARRKRETASLLDAVRAIDRAALPATALLDYDLFRRDVEEDVRAQEFPEELLAISQLSGPQYLSQVFEVMPTRTERDWADVLSRLGAIPVRLAQTEALLREGLSRGVVQPKIVLRDVPAQLEAQIPNDPLQAPLLKIVFRDGVPAQVRTDALRIFRERIVPAFAKFDGFFTREYLPRARDSVGLSALPGGAAWYAERVRRETTTELTAAQIHQLGLAEVKRIRGEMDKIIAQVGFKGDFAAFAKFLRTDPRFYFTDAQELVRAYRDIAKRIDPELTRLFGILPRLPYGVQEIPAFSAPSQTTAYYRPGSPEAHRAGMYFVNTWRLETRPKWEMEALTLHESVPGHHLQIALQ
ncbi:MAG TPA: DUF885 domain-containing protein, partial [Myxococcales bacterium]|nr:DUF885 domain-containing protein [Myxococcales bacterium]